MKKLLLNLLVVFISGTVGVFAQNEVVLESSRSNETVISISIDEFDFTEVNTPKGVESILQAPNADQIIEKGAPNLPKVVRSIIIPDHDKMEVEVLSSRYEDFKNIDLAPSKGHFLRNQNPEDIPYVYGDWYQTDAFYPGELAHLNDPYILRDFRGTAVDIYPFQYNPTTRTLRVYTEITLRITSSGEKGVNVFERKRELGSINREFHSIYGSQFINYESLYRYTPLEEDGDMLIIAHDEYLDAMSPFVEWKTTIGLGVEMVGTSTTGTTWQDINNYIESYYNDPSNDLIYVLFVGDAQHIPPVPASGTSVIEGYSDNYYGFLEGDDRYQEIFIGRFSAESIAHVETQVQRTLEYEQAYSFEDNWLNHGLGLARDEGSGNGHDGGEADDEHMENIRDRLLNYNYVEVYREYDGGSDYVDYNTTSAHISDRINSGVSVINFCNHGNWDSWSVGGYHINDVNALTNVRKLPFVWSVACIVGQFQGQTCFAETWLRATHNGEPTGAVAHFGSTINQPWHPPMDAQDEFNRILTQMFENNIKRSFGGISVNGMFDMLDKNNDTYGHRTAETWTIFGDPSVKVRTDNATNITVNHDPDIMYGPDYFEITVDTDDAFAALTKEGEIISTAKEDGGIIYIPISEGIEVGDEVTIAVTAYNKVPYIVDLDVIVAGAYANFTAEPTEILIGESVIFTDTSDPDDGEFETWEWEFGDGAEPATATGEGPHTVTYNTPGQKTVSLLVDGEYERVRENYITVNDIVTLTVNINGSGTVQIDGSEYNEPIELAENSTVSLEAIPDDLWHFDEWSGDLSGVYASTNLVMDENKTITANFIDCSGMTLPFAENFDASSELPVCWEIVDHQGNDQVWQIGDPGHLDGTTGNYAYLDSDSYGSGNSQNSDLVTPLLDLSNYIDIEISFTHYYRDYQSESASLSYSIDGGETWNQVEDWGGNTTDNPATYSQVIDEVAGEQAVQFKWNYTGTWGYYWNVDNIEVTGAPAGIYADFTVNPTIVDIGETVTFTDASGGGDITSWSWDFGDGANPATATGQGPHDITYDSYGSKTVSLTVNDGEHTETKGDYITVQEYESFSDWIHWDDGVNANAVGLEDGGVFYVASRWEPEDIEDYDEMKITKMRMFINHLPSSLEMIIWQGADESNLSEVYSQAFDGSEESWVEVELDTPYQIDASQELWFGYLVDDPGEGVFTAGLDAVTNHDGKGNKVKIGEEGEWENLSQYVDGDFNLQAFVEESEEFLPGDINGDGIVNVLDVVLMVNLILDGEYHPAGDLTDPEGEITTSDLTALVNIIMGYDRADDHINSEPAFISITDKQIGFESDGTVAAILFEIEAENAAELKPVLNSSEHKSSYKIYDNKLRAIVYSTNNTPLPENTESLLTLENEPVNMQWGELDASNTASGAVDLFSKTVTGLDPWDVLGFDVSIYPNPNKGEFVVTIRVPKEIKAEISMFDVMGREVLPKTQKICTEGNNEIKIDRASMLDKGFYVIRIKGFDYQSNELIFTEDQKVLIQY